MVENVIRVDGEVSSVPSVAPVESDGEEEADKHSDPKVESGECGNDKRVVTRLDPTDDHVEIEGRPGVDTETIVHTDNVVEHLMVRRDPADPVKGRQGGEDETREEKVDKHGQESNSE